MSHSLIADFQRFSLFAVHPVGGLRNFTNQHLLLVGLAVVPQNRLQHNLDDAMLQFEIIDDRRTKYMGHCTDSGRNRNPEIANFASATSS
jgi:hypothetical protein